MQLYHSGSHSNVYHTGTGDLYINSNNSIIFSDPTGNNTGLYAKFTEASSVELYHDGLKKFETTSTGAQVTGNLNVTGVLTYDDVTNIDSLGIVTARTGVDVNAGGINVDGGGLNIVGVSTFANNIDANGDLDVDGHTNLDNVSVVGTTTITQSDQTILALKVVGNTQFQGAGNSGDVTFVGAGNYNLAWDKSGNNLDFDDGVKARFGSNNRLQISSSNTLARFRLEGGVPLTISKSTTEDIAKFIPDGAVELYHNNTKRFETTSQGIEITGHSELDNVNISGLTTAALLNVSSLTDTRVTFASASGRLVDSANLTFDGTNLTAASAKISDLTSGRVVTAGTNGALQDSANLTFNGSLLDVTGNLAVSGNVSIAGTLTYQDVTNVDSVGIATARVGIKVLAGGVEIDGGGLDVVGVSTFNIM